MNREKKQIFWRLIKMGIIAAGCVAGAIFLGRIFNSKIGMKGMLLCAVIALGYLCRLNFRKEQWLEFIILLVGVGITGYALLTNRFMNKSFGFIPIAYSLYGIGRVVKPIQQIRKIFQKI